MYNRQTVCQHSAVLWWKAQNTECTISTVGTLLIYLSIENKNPIQYGWDFVLRHHFIFLLQLCIVLITNTLYDFSCCCYRKGTNFQANHNTKPWRQQSRLVVVATAKVRIFKQITTDQLLISLTLLLLLLPQRYEFSSKSQHPLVNSPSCIRCCCYRKGTNFQANHNCSRPWAAQEPVVVATAKVRIFKQITTSISPRHHG